MKSRSICIAFVAFVLPLLPGQTPAAGSGQPGFLIALSDAATVDGDLVLNRTRYEELFVLCVKADGSRDAAFAGIYPARGFRRATGGPDAAKTFESIEFRGGVARLSDGVVLTGETPAISVASEWRVVQTRIVDGRLSLLPAIVAIVLAVLTREVLLALLAGAWSGIVILVSSAKIATARLLDTWLIQEIANPDHAKILVFTSLLGGVVAMISRMGGAQALVDAVAKRARSGRSAQITTWALGIFVFFDDYANALLVGNTMRPITDRLRVSREKLAYLVDTTSAPVACIAVISTWIAVEISYIDGWLAKHPEGIAGYSASSAYQVFLESVPFAFYPIFALAFALCIAAFNRDLGPMYRAEVRARTKGLVVGENARPMLSDEIAAATPLRPDRLRVVNGVLPILVIILGTIGGLYINGISRLPGTIQELQSKIALGEATPGEAANLAVLEAARTAADEGRVFAALRVAFGAASSYDVLLWATFAGLAAAWLLAITQRIMGIRLAMETTVSGVKAMLGAALVLICAWTLAAVVDELRTSGFLIEQVSFSLAFLPAVAFLLASVIAFATGTSWGTMTILVPLVLTFAHTLGQQESASPEALRTAILGCVGAVLAGAVFGDHCSPISDTTVMSSMACGSDHIDHVKTQLPYALWVGLISLVVGYLPAGFGVSPIWLLPLGVTLCILVVRFVGRPLPEGQSLA